MGAGKSTTGVSGIKATEVDKSSRRSGSAKRTKRSLNGSGGSAEEFSISFGGSEKLKILANEIYSRMPCDKSLLHVLSNYTGTEAFMHFLMENAAEENLFFYLVSCVVLTICC